MPADRIICCTLYDHVSSGSESALAFTVISLGPALPQESIRRDIPEFGVAGAFDAPLLKPRGLRSGGLNPTTAITALKRLSPEETLIMPKREATFGQ